MSGIRKCADCGRLFRIENDGPEAMRGDGTFPRHTCQKCIQLRAILHALSMWPDTETQFVRMGSGPEAKLVYPRKDQEALVLSVRWEGDKLAADVCEEDSGKIIEEKVLFELEKFDKALEPLLAHLNP